jgi:hypothetical protein
VVMSETDCEKIENGGTSGILVTASGIDVTREQY